MRAGALDRRVTLQRSALVKGPLGRVEQWSDLATVSASRADLSDGELARASQVGATITTRFQIRWSSLWADLTPKDRLVCEGRTYGIVGVKEIQRRRGLEISASAQVDIPVQPGQLVTP